MVARTEPPEIRIEVAFARHEPLSMYRLNPDRLRTARICTRLSQAAFAALCGWSAARQQSLEGSPSLVTPRAMAAIVRTLQARGVFTEDEAPAEIPEPNRG